MPEPKRPLKVFLCHAHADRDAVRALYKCLTNDGVDAWLDKEKLLPGQDWELEIKKAVREADVVVVCLSKQFNQAGFRQKEVRLALDTAMEKTEGEIFIIPARLEECDNLESLRKWHWVDLFEDDGYFRLKSALSARANNIGAFLTAHKANNDKKPAREKKPLINQEQKSINFRKFILTSFIFIILIGLIYTYYEFIPSSLKTNPSPISTISATEPLLSTVESFVSTSLPLPPISKVIASNFLDPLSCPKWLLFHSFRDSNLEIYRIDGIEGSLDFSLINLTNNDGTDSRPSRSLDNESIVFQSNRNGNVDIYLVDSLGNGLKRLTNNSANNSNPMFGFDNKSVVYQSDRNGTFDLYLLNIDTGQDKQITFDSGDDINPYWSPDLDWLAFGSNRSGKHRIYLLNIPTGKEYQIDNSYSANLFSNNGDYNLLFPAWSPNGEQLAFLFEGSGSTTLVISDLQGKIVYTANTYTGSEGNYMWSPDGSRIAYQKQVNENVDIYVFDIKTNIEYRVTDNESFDSGPSWDCSGENIAFTSNRDGDPNIYIVPWDGGEAIRVTNHTATDKWPLWSPLKALNSLGY